MAWIGKFLGGTFGFMFGGPLGMVAGIAFGHLFDKADDFGKHDQNDSKNEQSGYRWWEDEQFRSSYQQQQQRYQQQSRTAEWKPFSETDDEPHEKLKITQKQLLFFTGTFSMIYCVASADGSVTQDEIVTIERDIITGRLKFSTQEGRLAMKFFRAAQENNSTIDAYAKQFYEVFSSSPALLQLMVDFLYQVRAVDKDASGKKEQMIRQVASIFALSDDVVLSISRKYDSPLSEVPYATLRLTSSATQDEVKRAYRKLCVEFHPDTLASQGLGSEFKKVAEELFGEINTAYTTIKQQRGWQ